MKKFKAFIVLLLVFVLLLSGCANDKFSSVSESSELSDNTPLTASFLQGVPSGLWYMLSNGISESLNKTYPGSLLQITPGGTVPNSLRVSQLQADFAMTHSHIALSAVQGIRNFDAPCQNLKSIAAFYNSMAQLVVSEDLGVQSFDDIINQKIKLNASIGTNGGSFHEGFLLLLEAYGTSQEEMEGWGCNFVFKGLEDTSRMFSDGQLNAFFIIGSSPSPQVMENAVNKNLVLVSFGEEEINYLCDHYGFEAGILSADAYPFLSKDLLTFGTWSILITADEVSDEEVYKITRAIHENLTYLQEIHASLRGMTGESLTNHTQIPLHPGAEMYYREAGLLSD
jgi:uncharacterized protein